MRYLIAILVTLMIGLPASAGFFEGHKESFNARKWEVKTAFTNHGGVFGVVWIPVSIAGLAIDWTEDTWEELTQWL